MRVDAFAEGPTRKRRRHLFPEEARDLLATAKRARGAKAERNFVLLALALNAGLGVSDVRWLNLSDYSRREVIDDEGRPIAVPVLAVRSRGLGARREVVLDETMAARLAEWCESQRDLFHGDAPMFSTLWFGERKRLTERQLEKIFKAVAAAAGIEDTFSFRALRVTFGVFYWIATGDALGLREQLGLESVEGTIAGFCRERIAERAANMRRLEIG